MAPALQRRLRTALASALLFAPLAGAVGDAEYATLADAAMSRDPAAVRALLERGADVNADRKSTRLNSSH